MKNNKDYVVLLHGFWRTAKSMGKIENVLTKKGYAVINVDYPSRREKIENLSDNYLKKCIEERCTDKSKKIHFVTHSMGGIIVRYFLSKHKLINLGKVIMIAPPNKGSKLADYLSSFPILNTILGPALKQLSTKKNSLPNKIIPPKYPVGIIAGKYDEKVPMESAKLTNMQDFLLVSSTHTYIMDSGRVIKAVQRFLEEGKF
ncbi:MAG: alpha/beta fold hydrolase [Candidatus Peregrinibacteria bacterium]|nr:alpha/beta fold hydrolase [Candidatus Peregrinibacteria bacterium]